MHRKCHMPNCVIARSYYIHLYISIKLHLIPNAFYRWPNYRKSVLCSVTMSRMLNAVEKSYSFVCLIKAGLGRHPRVSRKQNAVEGRVCGFEKHTSDSFNGVSR